MRDKIYFIATKPLLLAFCLAFGFLVSSLVRAQGRAPAVLPERGLSIEERRQIPPKEAREFGFNFKQVNAAKTATVVEAEDFEKPAERETSTTLMIFALIILAMPLFLWFGLMKQLKKQRAEILANAPVSLEEFRARQEAKKSVGESNKDKKDSKENLPKAS